MAIVNPTIFSTGSGGIGASLVVAVNKGAVVTAVNGDFVVRAVADETGAVLKLPKAGEWSVSASLNGQTTLPEIVTVLEEYPVTLSFLQIYGISRDTSTNSTAWVRTDDAVGKAATASVGTVAGHSDFDNCYPWSEMVRETLPTGDVMVKIPEFWFERKVTNGVETIRIANKPSTGFVKHPGSGKYVGAYMTSNNDKSIAGEVPNYTNIRRVAREYATAKGASWRLLDLATVSAIQMLYLIEFANNNSKSAVGYGYGGRDDPTIIRTGSCDGVSNLSGRPSGTYNRVDVVYRGIEGFWGGIGTWIDGLNYNGDTNNYYVSTDPSQYTDDTATGYTKVSFTSPTANAYISKEGIDTALPWVMLPSEATGGSEATFYSDYFYRDRGWRVAMQIGSYNADIANGIWAVGCSILSSATNIRIGSRLLYDPSSHTY